MAKKKPSKSAPAGTDPAPAKLSAKLSADTSAGLSAETPAADSATPEKQSSLKKAAKRLQRDFDERINAAVKQIRKETEKKLKDVVKAASRQLEQDTEQMVNDALRTILDYYQPPQPKGGEKKKRKGDKKKPAPVSDTADSRGEPATDTSDGTLNDTAGPKRRGRRAGSTKAVLAAKVFNAPAVRPPLAVHPNPNLTTAAAAALGRRGVKPNQKNGDALSLARAAKAVKAAEATKAGSAISPPADGGAPKRGPGRPPRIAQADATSPDAAESAD